MRISLVQILNDSGIAVIPTDTIYGIVARAADQEAVEKVYTVRRRNPDKPCIILISKIDDLKIFGIDPKPFSDELHKHWPGPVSIVLPCLDPEFTYLHRGTNSLAFRMPDVDELRELISATGPLIAPSANIEGNNPSATIDEAKIQFGDSVDLYEDAGRLVAKPSTIISLLNGKPEILRK